MKKKLLRANRSAKQRSVSPRFKFPMEDTYALRPPPAMIRHGDLLFFVQLAFGWVYPGRQLKMNWHIKAIVFELEQMLRGNNQWLMINVQPRSLKSFIISVAFPAFVLAHYPNKHIILITYGSALSEDLMKKFRAVVNAPEYKGAFSEMQISHESESEVTTAVNGWYKATSIGGTLTGLGADILIADDLLKAGDAQSKKRRERVRSWFEDALGRIDDKKNGLFIIAMQRLHRHDICGTLPGGQWKHLKFAAIAEHDERIQIGEDEYHHRHAGEPLHPDYESLETLKKWRSQMDPHKWLTQYQQNPPLSDDALLTRDMFRYYDKTPERTASDFVLQSWDTAAKTGKDNDRSACTTWLVKNHIYYLIGAMWGQFRYSRLKDIALEKARQYKPNVMLIESSTVGDALIDELRQAGLSVVEVTPHKDKITRMAVAAAKFAANRVFFPVDNVMADFEDELLTFPNGPHDDIVDSVSQALTYKIERSEGWPWSDEGIDNLLKFG